MYKKSFVICLLLMLMVGCFKLKKVDATERRNIGHDGIITLDVKDNVKLLCDMSDEYLKAFYGKVENVAFGWSAYTINEEIECKYVSQIIFAKSNNSSKTVTYDYTLRYQETEETVKTVSGSIGGKITGKIKGITPTVEFGLSKDSKKSTKTFYEEKTEFKMEVLPNKKLTLRVSGDAILSTGVGKYKFLGITFKKGTWEYIDKVNEYYELYEEDM